MAQWFAGAAETSDFGPETPLGQVGQVVQDRGSEGPRVFVVPLQGTNRSNRTNSIRKSATVLQVAAPYRSVATTAATALAQGLVRVVRVEASGVIELEDLEDEEPRYFFDVRAGQVLRLRGQDLYAAEPHQPNTLFEIVSPTSPPVYLGIFSYGEKLHPRRTVSGSDCNEIDYGSLPSQTGLVKATLDEVEAAITHEEG